jgi:hypothetical protein
MRFASLMVLSLMAPSIEAAPCDQLSLKQKLRNRGTWNTTADMDSNKFTILKWGQGVTLYIVYPANLKPDTIAWTEPDNAIQGYEERINDGLDPELSNLTGYKEFPVEPDKWDLSKPELTVYFKPLPGQSNDKRTVKVMAKLPGALKACPLERQFQLSRADRPAELYTSDNVGTNLEMDNGRVIKDHLVWHSLHMLGGKIHKHPSFLHWHHLFVDRYIKWRKTFGYGGITAIYPGDPISKNDLYKGAACNPSEFPPKVSSTTPPAKLWNTPVVNVSNLAELEAKVEPLHDEVHGIVGKMCTIEGFGRFTGVWSPKSELFWRFHLALDIKHYVKHCLSGKPLEGCPNPNDPAIFF